MQTIEQLLAEAPAFNGHVQEHLELIAGCAQNKVFEDGAVPDARGRPGRHLLRHPPRPGGARDLRPAARRRDDRDDRRRRPARLVLARAAVPRGTSTPGRSAPSTSVAFDAACLRGKADDDPVLGYELMRRFIPVIVERLQATRVRLLDVYGHVGAG